MNETNILVATDAPSLIFDGSPADLDRLAASVDALALCCCEPCADETSDHVAFESVGDHKPLLGDAARAASERL